MSDHEVKIRLNGESVGTVEVGGHDMSSDLNWVSLSAGVGNIPRVELGLLAVSLDAELRAEVELSDPSQAALMALGWTPPRDPSEG